MRASAQSFSTTSLVARPALIMSQRPASLRALTCLDRKLQSVFDRGLVSAAASTNAWVITGGTDTGVMKLVGNAFNSAGESLPLIGVASYGCVKGREAFDKMQARRRRCPIACAIACAWA